MINENDFKHLKRHFPNADWGSLFWGFVCYSRQNYSGVVPLDAEDEIMLGIQHPDGGCLCELAIKWHLLQDKPIPRLEAFSEAWHLLQTDTLQSVLKHLTQEKEPLPTPDELSALLIDHGFVDQSDRPLPDSALVVEVQQAALGNGRTWQA